MSSIGSRLAGATQNPQFGAGYPSNQSYKGPTNGSNQNQTTPQSSTSYSSYNSNPSYMGSSSGLPSNPYPSQPGGNSYPRQPIVQQQSPYQTSPYQQQQPQQQYQPQQQQQYHPQQHQQYQPPHPYQNPQQYPPQSVGPYGSNGGQYGQPGQVPFGGAQNQSFNRARVLGNYANKLAPGGMAISNEFAEAGITKILEVKDWGLKSFRITKQVMNEKLGKGTRTVDFILEEKIEKIKDTKSRYTRLLELATLLQTQLTAVQGTKRAMAEVFGDLSQKQRELEGEMIANGRAFESVNDQSATLIKTLATFTDGLKTLVERTIQDSLDTITKYEKTRVEFDAYRTNMEEVQMAPRRDLTGAKLRDAQMQMDRARQEYEKKRHDVSVKLELLDENRIKVMRQQLVLLHSATVAYFNGASDKLSQTMKVLERYQEENSTNQEPPSFLELDHGEPKMPKIKTGSRLANYTTEGNQSEGTPLINTGATPPCGRTPSGGSQDGFGGFQTDMLGNPVIPIEQTSKPMVDMLGNPIEQPSPVPEEQNQKTQINGVSIVGVVNSTPVEPENKKEADNVPIESINLISTEDDDLESKFKEATI